MAVAQPATRPRRLRSLAGTSIREVETTTLSPGRRVRVRTAGTYGSCEGTETDSISEAPQSWHTIHEAVRSARERRLLLRGRWRRRGVLLLKAVLGRNPNAAGTPAKPQQ